MLTVTHIQVNVLHRNVHTQTVHATPSVTIARIYYMKKSKAAVNAAALSAEKHHRIAVNQYIRCVASVIQPTLAI